MSVEVLGFMNPGVAARHHPIRELVGPLQSEAYGAAADYMFEQALLDTVPQPHNGHIGVALLLESGKMVTHIFGFCAMREKESN